MDLQFLIRFHYKLSIKSVIGRLLKSLSLNLEQHQGIAHLTVLAFMNILG